MELEKIIKYWLIKQGGDIESLAQQIRTAGYVKMELYPESAPSEYCSCTWELPEEPKCKVCHKPLRPTPKRKQIEKLVWAENLGFVVMMDKINELVEAINELDR